MHTVRMLVYIPQKGFHWYLSVPSVYNKLSLKIIVLFLQTVTFVSRCNSHKYHILLIIHVHKAPWRRFSHLFLSFFRALSKRVLMFSATALTLMNLIFTHPLQCLVSTKYVINSFKYNNIGHFSS